MVTRFDTVLWSSEAEERISNRNVNQLHLAATGRPDGDVSPASFQVANLLATGRLVPVTLVAVSVQYPGCTNAQLASLWLCLAKYFKWNGVACMARLCSDISHVSRWKKKESLGVTLVSPVLTMISASCSVVFSLQCANPQQYLWTSTSSSSTSWN